MNERINLEINSNYFNQEDNSFRVERADVVNKPGGKMPESVGGYDGIESIRIRRSMRRISRTGKR